VKAIYRRNRVVEQGLNGHARTGEAGRFANPLWVVPHNASERNGVARFESVAQRQHKTFVMPEEYLGRERTAEFRSEYLDGEVFPRGEAPVRVGSTPNHSTTTAQVTAAVVVQVATALTERCEAFLTGDKGLRRVTELRVLVLDDRTP